MTPEQIEKERVARLAEYLDEIEGYTSREQKAELLARWFARASRPIPREAIETAIHALEHNASHAASMSMSNDFDATIASVYIKDQQFAAAILRQFLESSP